MKHVYMSVVKEEIEFAEKAAKHFAANPKHWSFTTREITPGCLFALRWGLDDDCVLVFKLADDCDPKLYAQLVRQFEPSSGDPHE